MTTTLQVVNTKSHAVYNHTNTTSNSPQHTLREFVQQAMNNYLSQLGDFPANNVYDMVLSEIELPLFQTVMLFTKENQTKAAEILGISRGTLRKKLKQYGMLDKS